MIYNFRTTFSRRPTWQRYLLIATSVFVTAILIWFALLFVIAFGVLALLVAAINQIKLKFTGRPLFKGPQHFHRYQSQFNQPKEPSTRQGNVIEGEVIRKDENSAD